MEGSNSATKMTERKKELWGSIHFEEEDKTPKSRMSGIPIADLRVLAKCLEKSEESSVPKRKMSDELLPGKEKTFEHLVTIDNTKRSSMAVKSRFGRLNTVEL